MLKKRIVACLIIHQARVVQSIGFKNYLPVGSVSVAVEFLNLWGIDEILLLDIDASAKGKKPDFKMITKVSKKGFVPLTVGGGIKSLDDMRTLIACGADKISINKAALTKPEIINQAAKIFGSQCIVVSMDVKKNSHGNYEVFSDSGKKATGLDPIKWACEAEKLSAGEILINSIDLDGSKLGYDIKLVKKVAEAVNIPVVACGGAGKPDHFLKVLAQGGASAAVAGNFFHFTEHSPIVVKSYLRNRGLDVRLETYADYEGINFDKESGRILKRPDHYLEKLRFEYHPAEII